MPGPKVFPSILPTQDNKKGEEIPKYWEFDWDQLRGFAGGIQGVDGKGSKKELLKRLDNHYGVTYGMDAYGDNGDTDGSEREISGADE